MLNLRANQNGGKKIHGQYISNKIAEVFMKICRSRLLTLKHGINRHDEDNSAFVYKYQYVGHKSLQKSKVTRMEINKVGHNFKLLNFFKINFDTLTV